MKKRKINNKLIICDVDDKSPTRITFDGRKIRYSNLEHQHLSNIYWHNTILHGREPEYDMALNEEINKRFGGEILYYIPLKKFNCEISLLRSMGHIMKDVYGREKIYFKGEWVGFLEK